MGESPTAGGGSRVGRGTAAFVGGFCGGVVKDAEMKEKIRTACLPLKSAAEASHARLDWMRVAYLQKKMRREREKGRTAGSVDQSERSLCFEKTCTS